MSGRDPVTALRDYMSECPDLDGVDIGVAVPETEPIFADAEGEILPPPVNPDTHPDQFIRLMLSGEVRKTIVHRRALVFIECWHKGGEAEASDLMEIVYRWVDRWQPVPVFDGWASGPFSQEDPYTGISRYVAGVNIDYRTDERL